MGNTYQTSVIIYLLLHNHQFIQKIRTYYVLNYLLSNSFIIFEDKGFFFVSRINVSVLNIFVRIYGLKLCDCVSEEIYLSPLLIKMSRFYCHDNILDS